MLRRSLSKRRIRNLTKVSGGKSSVITLPWEFVQKLKQQTRQKLEVHMYGDRIIISDWKK